MACSHQKVGATPANDITNAARLIRRAVKRKRYSAMLLLKGCPRCHGDLTLESDGNTTYLECMQCGHVINRAQEQALGLRTTRFGLVHVLRGSAALEERPPAVSR